MTFPAATSGAAALSESYAYDANSNRTLLTRRGGAQVTYGYDALNRLTGVTQPATAGYANYTYVYDNLNHLRQANSSQGDNYAYLFDAQGHVTIEGGPNGNMTSAYDGAGNRTRLTWPDGFYAAYGYDLTGAMTSVGENGATSGPGLLASFGYDDLGRRVSFTRGNGTSTTYGYNAAQLLSTLTHSLPQAGASETETFSYNLENQVVQSTKSNDGWAWTNAYTFDRTYGANGLNEQTASGSSTLTYGATGTLTNDSGTGTTYAYDAANQLFGVSTGSTQQYDANGRTYSAGANGATRFLYDGSLAVAEYNSSGAITQRYVPGPGVDEPIAWYDANGRKTLMADRQGSITGVANDSGTLVALNSYDEYGLPGTNNAGRYQYTGQKYMGEYGLYDYKARNYSPTLGRFIQPDPSGYGAGMHLYAYAGVDPVDFIDPTGLDPVAVKGIKCPGGTEPRNPHGDDAQCVPIGTPFGGLFGGWGPLLGSLFPSVSLGIGGTSSAATAPVSQSSGCPSPPISRSEAAAAQAGNRQAFWDSRAARGDPLGPTGDAIVNNTGEGEFANDLLFTALVDRGRNADEARSEMQRIGVQLMRAQVNAVNTFGSPSAAQIAAYHFQVFAAHGLPNTTFGGSMVTGTEAEATLTSPIWRRCP